MTRVIAGIARGHRLVVPVGGDTRPTSDRAREGLFASVGSLLGPLTGARVADLYAGSGAVGLEALSRGAAHALLVESGQRALRAIRANVAAVALPGAVVVPDRVERVVAQPPVHGPYDLIFADPPYATDDERVTAVLRALDSNRWLDEGALIVVERAKKAGPLAWPEGYVPVQVRHYGDTALWYGRAARP